MLVWDTFWYAGHYPLLGYSLLYYFPAALVGNDLVALVSVVAAAALFASLAHREWGEAARWPSRLFAVVACGPLFTGTYPYAAGFAAGLAALKALQLGRPWLAAGLAALTLGLSPLAFLFLCLAALAAFLGRRPSASTGSRSAWDRCCSRSGSSRARCCSCTQRRRSTRSSGSTSS